jgi:glycosyltransferase involved in cell wall biosynthesis
MAAGVGDVTEPIADANDRPLVAIVIPVYNAERYLDETLRSARTQTLTAIEILVVDDGSRDGSLDIAKSHATEDARVRVVSIPNGGAPAARNVALRLAEAPFVALLDADDISLPERVERQVRFLLANPDVAVLGTHGWRIGQDGRELGVFDVGPVDREHFASLRARDEVIYLLASSVMVRREVALAVGGFRDVKYAEDADLWTRIADDHIVLAISDRLVRYRIHPASDSSRHFFVQMKNALLIKANCSRRRSGAAEIDLVTLDAELNAQPLPTRIRRAATWRSQYCYRVAGGLLANREPAGLAWLALSFVIAPMVPVNRLRRQILPWLVARR